MQTHSTGPIRGGRQGSVETFQTVPVDTASATSTFVTATAKKILSIKASTANPVYVEFNAIIQTASNASGACTLSIGKTGAGYTDIFSAVNLKAAADVSYPAKSATYAAPTAQAAATYSAPATVPADSTNPTNPLTTEFNAALANSRLVRAAVLELAADNVAAATALAAAEVSLAALAVDQASGSSVRRLYTANTDIYAIVTCSAYGAAGKAYIIAKMTELNVKVV